MLETDIMSADIRTKRRIGQFTLLLLLFRVVFVMTYITVVQVIILLTVVSCNIFRFQAVDGKGII